MDAHDHSQFRGRDGDLPGYAAAIDAHASGRYRDDRRRDRQMAKTEKPTTVANKITTVHED
jgi:hypothetical protein